MKTLSTTDNLTLLADRALRTVFGKPLTTDRSNPANSVAEADLTRYEKDEAGRLMRVNHVGEVCAQALYQGQALTAKDQRVQQKLKQASAEENDHLAWCEQRLSELDSRKSLLNPLWYAGSFCIGATAGLLGDKWSLGFLAETEKQVVEHLDEHLERLPETDEKSRAIVEQMKIDEGEHATTAIRAGGVSLPEPVRKLMKLSSKVMTGTAHWI